MTSPTSRTGWLAAEALVGVLVGLLLLGALVGSVRAALRGGELVSSRVEALETARTVWAVLEEELGAGVMGRDWYLDSDGAIALRAFRGFGRICGHEDGTLTIAYRGTRLPDPGRDSLLILGPDGRWSPDSFELVSAPGLCTELADERVVGVAGLTRDPDRVVLIRVFERGSYHLADGAFRYRRGGGGRQPLTPERIAETSRFELSERGVVASVEMKPTSGVGPFTWALPSGLP